MDFKPFFFQSFLSILPLKRLLLAQRETQKTSNSSDKKTVRITVFQYFSFKLCKTVFEMVWQAVYVFLFSLVSQFNVFFKS